MANRPVYVANPHDPELVRTLNIDFQWFPGMALAQKQRSIDSLHTAAAAATGSQAILEISSKSRDALGRALSAFALTLYTPISPEPISVECAFQGSKVFANGGPFQHLYETSSIEAKRYDRLWTSGRLTGFRFVDQDWPIEPRTAFYDWLYCQAVRGHAPLASHMLKYTAFTDIEFNPTKSINCQASAAALFVSLTRRGQLDDALSSQSSFLTHVDTRRKSELVDFPPDQLSLL